MMRPIIFKDRQEAGRRLAEVLSIYANQPDVAVLGLARGGLVVASETARLLNLSLDVLVVRKLGVPGHEELAMGAIASGGGLAMNEEVIGSLHISHETVQTAIRFQQKELVRREDLYRKGHPPLNIRNRTLLVIDDGLATGATMRAAISALRRQHPARLVVAIPVASEETCHEIQTIVDEVVCLSLPESFIGVGAFYKEFAQTTDEEVCKLLQAARLRFPASCQPKVRAS